MATRFLSCSSLTTSKPTFNSLFTRSLTSFSISKPPQTLSLLHLRPVVAVYCTFRSNSLPLRSVRGFSTCHTTSSLNASNPNWSNCPPEETKLPYGCDFEHWLVVVENPVQNWRRDQIIDSYIKILAKVVGSEEEARMKIYSVSTRHYFSFGALVSEELSYKIKEQPGVLWVLPDSYMDAKNKDYGGEPFINGQAVPYEPKYHEEWVRNSAASGGRRIRVSGRPRHQDRSRNFERRRQMLEYTRGSTFQGVPHNLGPLGNTGNVPSRMPGRDIPPRQN